MEREIARCSWMVLGLALIFFALSGSLISTNPFVIAGQVLAVALAVWARISFKDGVFSIKPEPAGDSVIEKGPYAMIRHPMYAAALLLVWSSILGHPSTTTFFIGLIVTVVIVNRIIVEEQLLRERFSDYTEYSRRTKMVIPYLL